ncbi:MAG: 50S ribosomal protein L3 [Actinobacteria bacterium]|nr:50S ribosomal protein L3 [Actinomycetota bacterium]
MTQIFNEDGTVVPVTAIEVMPNVVTGLRITTKDGYEAVQLGYKEVTEKKIAKPVIGQFKKNKLKLMRHLKEVRVESVSDYKIGQKIKAGIFKIGDVVKVTGISKGKGFAGVVKRYHFKGGPASHGAMFHRAPGSIGASSFPSRVDKGKRLPGRMGGRRVTSLNLKVAQVDEAKNILLLSGTVPGPRGGMVLIREV